MLRRDIRLFIFAASIILLVVALHQLRSTSNNSEPSHQKSIIQDLHPKEDSLRDQGRNLKSVDSNVAIQSPKYSLQGYVIRNVQQFVFFVGYARSGHSILASMLDAHPNVVISHEYSLFSKWEENPINHRDKPWLLSTLFDSSKANVDQGLRRQEARKKGYSLAVPGWWQGDFDGIIDVIGDKSGGLTAQVYRKSKEHFKNLYQELRRTVQMPIKVFHVVRNPYDNIATMVLYGEHQKHIVNKTNKYDDVIRLRKQITAYFNQVRSVIHMINEIPLDVIEVHNVDMITDPKGAMRKICEKLAIQCSEDYLHMCANTVFVAESKTRHLVKWTPELINMVADSIKNYQHLHRYSFTV